jgi:hypothetical protein
MWAGGPRAASVVGPACQWLHLQPFVCRPPPPTGSALLGPAPCQLGAPPSPAGEAVPLDLFATLSMCLECVLVGTWAGFGPVRPYGGWRGAGHTQRGLRPLQAWGHPSLPPLSPLVLFSASVFQSTDHCLLFFALCCAVIALWVGFRVPLCPCAERKGGVEAWGAGFPPSAAWARRWARHDVALVAGCACCTARPPLLLL